MGQVIKALFLEAYYGMATVINLTQQFPGGNMPLASPGSSFVWHLHVNAEQVWLVGLTYQDLFDEQMFVKMGGSIIISKLFFQDIFSRPPFLY